MKSTALPVCWSLLAICVLALAVPATGLAVQRPPVEGPSSSHQGVLTRQRRRSDQLGQMVAAATGRHFSEFLGYGSFCGFQGSGLPVDSLDACCLTHDRCFGKMKAKREAGKCSTAARASSAPSVAQRSSNTDANNDAQQLEAETAFFNRYWTKYTFSVAANGSIECHDTGDMSSGFTGCQRELCECDKALSVCLRLHGSSYNVRHLKRTQAVLRWMARLSDRFPNAYAWVWQVATRLYNLAGRVSVRLAQLSRYFFSA